MHQAIGIISNQNSLFDGRWAEFTSTENGQWTAVFNGEELAFYDDEVIVFDNKELCEVLNDYRARINQAMAEGYMFDGDGDHPAGCECTDCTTMRAEIDTRWDEECRCPTCMEGLENETY